MIIKNLSPKDAKEIISKIYDSLFWDAEAGQYDADKEVSGADFVSDVCTILSEAKLTPTNQ